MRVNEIFAARPEMDLRARDERGGLARVQQSIKRKVSRLQNK
jgi:hypothetical protein